MNHYKTKFSGKAEDWDTWKFLFEAAAVTYGYDGILEGTDAVPKKSEVNAFDPETKDTSEMRKKQLYKLNSLAIVHLIESMNSKTVEGNFAINVLKATRSDDYPTGNAFLALKKFNETYEGKFTDLVSLDDAFFSRKQRRMEDPNSFITELDILRNQRERSGHTRMSDKVFLAHILESLHSDYMKCIASFKEQRRANENMSLDKLRRQLADEYNRMSRAHWRSNCYSV